ncbi:MAG TPA: class I SAM-dependent methyltransferase [Acidimicrobiia bacterium]|nr:class I SAM-dependent methyltransferase [Acidimicrobiia bacterium]
MDDDRHATAWFDRLYDAAERNALAVPWASETPCPELGALLEAGLTPGRAIVVGCGLGDDAAALTQAGWATTAFDVSATAITWARERFGEVVDWHVADLFDLPDEWIAAFDLVVEVRTVQSLPPALQARAMQAVASLVRSRLLLVANLRPHRAIPTGPPWPLSLEELGTYEDAGLEEESIKTEGSGPGARVVATYVRS